MVKYKKHSYVQFRILRAKCFFLETRELSWLLILTKSEEKISEKSIFSRSSDKKVGFITTLFFHNLSH